MTKVTVSPKFQVVIPKKIREEMKLESGMQMEMINYNGRIELIPLGDIKETRGLLKGIDTNILREKDRL